MSNFTADNVKQDREKAHEKTVEKRLCKRTDWFIEMTIHSPFKSMWQINASLYYNQGPSMQRLVFFAFRGFKCLQISHCWSPNQQARKTGDPKYLKQDRKKILNTKSWHMNKKNNHQLFCQNDRKILFLYTTKPLKKKNLFPHSKVQSEILLPRSQSMYQHMFHQRKSHQHCNIAKLHSLNL